ncbi:MAG: hypothetical protein JWO06_1394 [Bacteroidota bacterium]|nr:hypothetical protein [Bacteroidota bacterium]
MCKPFFFARHLEIAFSTEIFTFRSYKMKVMKRVFYPLLLLLLLMVMASSCKKKYTCQCVDSTTHIGTNSPTVTANNSTDAEKECDQLSTSTNICQLSN